MAGKILTEKERTELQLPVAWLKNVLEAGAEVREPPRWFPVTFHRKPWQSYRGRRFKLAKPESYERRRLAYRQNSYRVFLECKAHLESAKAAITADLMHDKRAQLERRCQRLVYEILLPYLKAEEHTGKVGLISFYFLQMLVTEQLIVVGEDSDLQRALDLLLPGLEHLTETNGVDASAQKQARRIFSLMQRKGYYHA